MTLLTLLPTESFPTPPLAPALPAAVVDTWLPSATLEEQGDALHWDVDATTKTTSLDWMSGKRPFHEVLSDGSTATYARCSGSWDVRPQLTLKLPKIRRPHLGASTLRLTITHRTSGGTFSQPPRICIMDHAQRGKEWPHDARFDREVGMTYVYPSASSFSKTEIELDGATLLRGWGDGLANMGDPGIKLIGPTGPSAPEAEWYVSGVELQVSTVHPGEGEAAHMGVRPPSRTAAGFGWAVVDYNQPPNAGQLIQVGKEYYTAVNDGSPISGLSLNMGSGVHPVADAVKRGWYANPTPGGSGWLIVEVEPLVPAHAVGGETLLPWDINGPTNNTSTEAKRGLFKRVASSYNPATGVASGAGAYQRPDKVVIRSEVREATSSTYPGYMDDRAEVRCSGQVQTLFVFAGTKVDAGHIAHVGFRFYHTAGGIPILEHGFDTSSANAILGYYDCDFTGNNAIGNGQEFKTAIRGSYCSYDLMDCRCGRAVEHFLYQGVSPGQPTQMVRCRNMASKDFYPSHPDPGLPTPYLGFTMHQQVGRTNPTDASGEGPPSAAPGLDEDNHAENAGTTESTFTLVNHIGTPYVNRRCSTKYTNGSAQQTSPFLAWCDTEQGGQSNQPKGHHVSIGQFDGPESTFVVSLPYPPIPQQYPESGTVYAHGDITIEDWALNEPQAGSTSNAVPFRFCGAKSITFIRGNFKGYRTPTIADFPHNGANTWGTGGAAGPYGSLGIQFIGFGSPISNYVGWVSPSALKVRYGASQSGGGSFANQWLIATGNTADLKNTTSQYSGFFAGLVPGVDQLGPGNDLWPPWPQTNADKKASTFPAGRVYPGMRPQVFSLPQPGSNSTNWPSTPGSIPFPAINNFLALSAQVFPRAPAVGIGIVGVAHLRVTMSGTSSATITAGFTGFVYGSLSVSGDSTMAVAVQGAGHSVVTMSGSSTMTVQPGGHRELVIDGTSSMMVTLYDSSGGAAGKQFVYAPSAGSFTQSRSAQGRASQGRSVSGSMAHARSGAGSVTYV